MYLTPETDGVVYNPPARFRKSSHKMTEEEMLVDEILTRNDVPSLIRKPLTRSIRHSVLEEWLHSTEGKGLIKRYMHTFGFSENIQMLNYMCKLNPDGWENAKEQIMSQASSLFLLHTIEYIRLREGNEWVFQRYSCHNTESGGTPFLYSVSDEGLVAAKEYNQKPFESVFAYFDVPNDLKTGNLTWDYYIKFHPNWKSAPMDVWRKCCHSRPSDIFFRFCGMSIHDFVQHLTMAEELAILNVVVDTIRYHKDQEDKTSIMMLLLDSLSENSLDLLRAYQNQMEISRLVQPDVSSFVILVGHYIRKRKHTGRLLCDLYQSCRAIPNFEKVTLVVSDAIVENDDLNSLA